MSDLIKVIEKGLEDSYKSYRKQLMITGPITVAIWVAAPLLLFTQKLEALTYVAIGILIILGIVLVILLIASYANMTVYKPDEHNELLKALKESPHDIVWGYKSTTHVTQRVSGIKVGEYDYSKFNICLKNGKLFEIGIPTSESIIKVYLLSVNPKIVLGYSDDRNKLFYENPAEFQEKVNASV